MAHIIKNYCDLQYIYMAHSNRIVNKSLIKIMRAHLRALLDTNL